MSFEKPSTVKLAAAFAAVYLIWGSTYLAIRYAIQTIPPLVMASGRFLTGGAILYLWSRLNGVSAPSLNRWKSAFIAGVLLLTVGNGGVVLAEQTVPSGLTAVLVATVPLWVALLSWIRPGGRRPSPQVSIGIVLGLAGVATLIGIDNLHGNAVDHVGAAILVFSSISWALGSLYNSHVKLSSSPLQGSGMQMIAGGTCLFIASIVSGEIFHFHPAAVSLRSLAALAYLAVFGAIVAFTAYSWLLKATTAARAATYAYVNPVVAVFLGWFIAAEPITVRTIVAMSIIVAAVIVITTARTT